MDVTYLDFSQAFNAVFPSFLVSKLGCHGLDGWTTRCVEKLARLCSGEWFVLHLKVGYKWGYLGIPRGTCPAPALGRWLTRDLPRSLLT